MAEREFVVDYTVPYYDLVGTSIMMKKVKTDTSLFKFLSVLEGSVWGCILAAYFVTRWAVMENFMYFLYLFLAKFCFRILFTILVFVERLLFQHLLTLYSNSFLMWIFDRFSPYSYQNNMEKYKDDEEKRYFNLKECLW